LESWFGNLELSINRDLKKALYNISELSYREITKIITDSVILQGKKNGFKVEIEPRYPKKFQRIKYDLQPALFRSDYHREYHVRGDVLWINKITQEWFAMFEIDHQKKKHSLRKLLSEPACNNVWINWNEENILKKLHYHNKHLDIIIHSTPKLFFIRPDEKILYSIYKRIKLKSNRKLRVVKAVNRVNKQMKLFE
jgi:hypothetical protein